MQLDRSKLAKVLALTASDKEGEAINAMRLANKMLEQAGLTWGAVLEQRAAVSIRVFDFTPGGDKGAFDTGDTPDPGTNKPVIDQMFATVFAVAPEGEFKDWLMSINDQWNRYQRLTPSQYDGLRRSYARVMRHGGQK